MSWWSMKLFILVLGFQSLVLAADPSQLVQDLPGQPQVGFQHYAGHITINVTAGRALFYWFFEADDAANASLPVVLWLNGGPGCSSTGSAIGEVGPFNTNASGTGLVINPYAFTKAANMIFLEVPYNTGFSFTNLTSDSGYTDNQSAADSLLFLLEFFSRFPEYKSNEFYIAGESFAGHNVPILASQIISHNQQQPEISINLKGFIIGNPSTDIRYDFLGNLDTLYSHSVISERVYEGQKLCIVNTMEAQAQCNETSSDFAYMTQYINQFNLYQPVCTNSSCLFDPVNAYLNLPEVQAALHVTNRPVRWTLCNADIDRSYSQADRERSLLPLYRELFVANLRILIYSGDLDTSVSTLATRSWIRALNLTIVTPWYPWNYTGQVGGSAEIYSEMTFTTVRGAGHIVPIDAPGQALLAFQSFLLGKPLPALSRPSEIRCINCGLIST